MITGPLTQFAARCRQRGYTLDEVRPCIVSEDGDAITVDENHPAYPREPKPGPISSIMRPTLKSTTMGGGPGTELKKLLKNIGITASPNCSCNARAKKMDEWGPDECEKRMDEIIGWLKEEATKRKLPFIDYAGKIIVKKAIKNARKNK